MQRDEWSLLHFFLVSKPGPGAGVFGHPQVVQDQADVTRQLSNFLGYTADLFGFDYANSESAHSSDILRAVAGSDSPSVFIVVPVQNVMTTILNRPVAAIYLEHTLRSRFFGCSAGDAISHLTRALARFFIGEVTFNREGLTDMRKVQIVIELGCGPDLSNLDSSMVRRRILNKIRSFAVLEIERDIVEDSPLVPFDGKMI